MADYNVYFIKSIIENSYNSRVVENVSKAEVDAITKALVEAFDQRLSSDVLYLRRYALNKQRDDNQPQVILPSEN
jgi:hypothetical protein